MAWIKVEVVDIELKGCGETESRAVNQVIPEVEMVGT